MLALIIIVVLVLWIFVSCIKIVPQAQAYVIERLGAYQATWNVGFNLKIPFVDVGSRRTCCHLKPLRSSYAPDTTEEVTESVWCK